MNQLDLSAPPDGTEKALGLYAAQAEAIRQLLDQHAPQTTGNIKARVAQVLAQASIYEARLRGVLAAMQAYLPPDSASAKDTLTRICELVDPWPGPDSKAASRWWSNADACRAKQTGPDQWTCDCGGPPCGPEGVPTCAPSQREEAKKARPPSDEEPWVVADDEGVRVTFRTEDAAWRYRNEYTDRLTNPTVTREPATAGVQGLPKPSRPDPGIGWADTTKGMP